MIFIFSQAPTADKATRLAQAAATALQSYVRTTQERRGVPENKRIQLSSLGRPEGGVVTRGASATVFGLAFVGTFALWCLLVLLGGRVMKSFREARTPPPETYDDGFRSFPDDWTAELDWKPSGHGPSSGSNGDPGHAGVVDRIGDRTSPTG